MARARHGRRIVSRDWDSEEEAREDRGRFSYVVEVQDGTREAEVVARDAEEAFLPRNLLTIGSSSTRACDHNHCKTRVKRDDGTVRGELIISSTTHDYGNGGC